MASLLGMPPEIQDQIFQMLISDPTACPATTFQFLSLTCREISLRAKKLISLYPETAATKTITDWRLPEFDEEIALLTPLEINTIESLVVNAEIWAWAPEDLDDATIAVLDEDGCRFHEAHEEPADWLLEILGKLPGVDDVTLWSDGHGYLWDFDLIVYRVGTLKKMGEPWKVLEENAKDNTILLQFSDPVLSEGDWRLRDREILIDVR